MTHLPVTLIGGSCPTFITVNAGDVHTSMLLPTKTPSSFPAATAIIISQKRAKQPLAATGPAAAQPLEIWHPVPLGAQVRLQTYLAINQNMQSRSNLGFKDLLLGELSQKRKYYEVVLSPQQKQNWGLLTPNRYSSSNYESRNPVAAVTANSQALKISDILRIHCPPPDDRKMNAGYGPK